MIKICTWAKTWSLKVLFLMLFVPSLSPSPPVLLPFLFASLPLLSLSSCPSLPPNLPLFLLSSLPPSLNSDNFFYIYSDVFWCLWMKDNKEILTDPYDLLFTSLCPQNSMKTWTVFSVAQFPSWIPACVAVVGMDGLSWISF